LQRDKLLSAIGSSDLTSQDSEDKKKEKEPLLRVAPHPGVPICLPTVNLTEYLTSSSLCLSSYEERFQMWQAEAPFTMGKGGGKGCTARKGGKRQRMDSSSDKKPPAETSGTSVSVVKQKENVCLESEFVSCDVILDNACDTKPVCSSSALYHDEGGDNVGSGANGDINNMAVNHILPQQHLTGTIISARNCRQVSPLKSHMQLNLVTLMSVYTNN